MDCSIVKNENNNIVEVLTPTGQKSILFEEINRTPFLVDPENPLRQENVLRHFAMAYTDKYTKLFDGAKKNVYSTGEPQLFIRNSKNQEVTKLSDASLKDLGTIRFGFKNPKTDEFMEIFSVNTEAEGLANLIASQIGEGVLSDKMEIALDGTVKLQGFGNNPELREANAHVFENAALYEGFGNVSYDPNAEISIKIPAIYYDTTIGYVDGVAETVSIDEVPTKIKEKKYDNAGYLMDTYKEKNDLYRTNVSDEKIVNNNEDALKATLNRFLESLGFTKTTIDKYIKNYNQKFEQDPDVNALADIARKIVASVEGNIPLDQLTEEVSHIAIEAYSDQASITEALVNVIYTDEYREFSEYYRQKYASMYSGTMLEDAVRKEVLGKILAKEFTNNFETQPKTEEHGIVLTFLKDLWNSIVKYFGGRITNQHRRVLDDLNKKIVASVLENKTQDFKNELKGNPFIFFSATSKEAKEIESQLKIARKEIEDTFRQFKERIPRAKDLEKITKELSDNETLSSINVIVDIANQQLNVIEANIKKADSNNEVIDKRDETFYHLMSGNILNTLNIIKFELEKQIKVLRADLRNEVVESGRIILNNKINTVGKFILDIEEIGKRKSNLDPLVERGLDRLADDKIETLLGDANITEEQKEAIRVSVKGGFRDRGILANWIGLASASKNPIIKAMNFMVSKMRSKINYDFKNTYDTLLKTIYDKGLHKFQKDLIKKNSKGENTYYFRGPYDWSKREEDIKEFEIGRLMFYTNREREDLVKAMETASFREIIIKDKNNKSQKESYVKFIEDLKNFNRSISIQAMKPKYYEDRDKRYEDLNISYSTRETIENLSARIFEITKKARNKDGTVDKSKLSEGDKRALAGVKKDREMYKSFYDNFTEIKVGLNVVSAEKLSQQEIDALPYAQYLKDTNYKGDVLLLNSNVKSIEELPEESRIAYDMFVLNMYYLQQVQGEERSKTPTKKFFDEMDKADSSFDWVMDNATITLTDDYYKTSEDYESFREQVKKYVSEQEYDAEDVNMIEGFLEALELLNRKKRAILKQYKKTNNVLEVDAANMSIDIKLRIRELDNEIDTTKANIYKNLPELELVFPQDGRSVKGLNEDFKNDLENSSKDFMDFALEHMNDSHKTRVVKFGRQIEALLNNQRPYLEPSFENFFQQKLDEGVVTPSTPKEETIRILKEEYAKKFVASYYQRNSPKGYQELMDAMRNGDVSVKDAVNKERSVLDKYEAAQYINITPDYSWLDEVSNSEYVNSEYKKGGYYVKPSDKYLDMDGFFNHYGISVAAYKALEDDDISKLTPTKNKEEYELLVIMLKLKEMSNEKLNTSETTNKYLLVQKSKDSFEKVFSMSSARSPGATIADVFKDIVQNRPDELEYGAQVEGVDVSAVGSGINHRVIPKFYQEKLESPEVITENIIEAGFLNYYQALTYEQRKSTERDLLALEYKVKHQEFLAKGGSTIRARVEKGGESSNYFKSAQEYNNHHLYGIQQTRSFKTSILGKEVDLMRVLDKVQGMARFTNLAYNAFVDATGATTGIINNIIDKHVGDYYHKSSSNLANSQVASMMGDYAAEMGKTVKTSKMSALLETFGLIDPNFRTQGSKYGYWGRLLRRSPYLGSKASNLIIAPKILMSIINDHKFINGKFRSFNEFKSMKKSENKDVPLAQIEVEWKNPKYDSLYNNLDINENRITFNDNFKNKYPESTQKNFEDIVAKITTKAQHVLQSVDGVMTDSDRVAATRDAMTNLFMMHKGWLAIFVAKRFKARGYNFTTGQMEEGHYTTFYNSIAELRKYVSEKGFIKGLEETWTGMEDFQKRNIKRFGIESAIAAALLTVLGAMVLGSDDEDDSWIEDFFRLIFLRTTSEFVSTQIYGIPQVVKETYSSPIASTGTLEALWSVANPFAWVKKDDDYGNEAIKRIVKGSILKRYEQYIDLDDVIQKYRHFNSETLMTLGAMPDADERKFIEAWGGSLQD
jgi:hypothetical protein